MGCMWICEQYGTPRTSSDSCSRQLKQETSRIASYVSSIQFFNELSSFEWNSFKFEQK